MVMRLVDQLQRRRAPGLKHDHLRRRADVRGRLPARARPASARGWRRSTARAKRR
ncbi:MAG: hypothetical protein MZW92_04895 [Comamonadaceae bacterium]|nr:hypothetical protein [Comamonadaceae bacterium]